MAKSKRHNASGSFKLAGLPNAPKKNAGSTSGRTVMKNGISGRFIISKNAHIGATAGVAKTAPHVSASTLHRETRPTLDLLRSSDAVAVTHYNQVEGFLVAPGAYAALVDQAQCAGSFDDELASTVTLLLAAAHTGVPLPSDLLERVLPNVDVSERWREIAEFAASFPVRISHGEDGERITRASLSHVPGPIEEYGSDDELDLD